MSAGFDSSAGNDTDSTPPLTQLYLCLPYPTTNSLILLYLSCGIASLPVAAALHFLCMLHLSYLPQALGGGSLETKVGSAVIWTHPSSPWYPRRTLCGA